MCTRSGFGVASAQSQNSKSRSLLSFVNTNCLLSWSRPDFFDTCWPPEVFYCWYYFSPIERKSSIIWLLVSFEWSLIQDCVSSSFLFVSARAKIARGSGVRDVTEPSEYFLLRIFPPLLYYFFCAKRENCLSCVFFFFPFVPVSFTEVFIHKSRFTFTVEYPKKWEQSYNYYICI